MNKFIQVYRRPEIFQEKYTFAFQITKNHFQIFRKSSETCLGKQSGSTHPRESNSMYLFCNVPGISGSSQLFTFLSGTSITFSALHVPSCNANNYIIRDNTYFNVLNARLPSGFKGFTFVFLFILSTLLLYASL